MKTHCSFTSQDQSNSSPYLRFENSERTSKSRSILFYSTRKTRKFDQIGAPGGRFETFHPFCRKSSKQLRGPLGGKNIFEKSLQAQCRKKLGNLWDFSTSILSHNSKKTEGEPFGEKNCEKKYCM